MTSYESEGSDQLQIRRERGSASNVSLTPQNVRRVYDSIRTPDAPLGRAAMTSPYFDVTELYNEVYGNNGVGVGNPNPTTTTAVSNPTSVGVGAPPAQPSTSRISPPPARTGVGLGGVAARSIGKQPRASPGASARLSARRRRRVREAAELRRARQQGVGGAGGGGDGGGGGDSSGGSDRGGGRGGRRLNNDLDRLLANLRRRTDGRHIAGITHTDTITTTYKDGRPPTVSRSSTRASGTST